MSFEVCSKLFLNIWIESNNPRLAGFHVVVYT